MADAGPRAVFGAIDIGGHASVDERVIRRELTFHPGEEYRLSEITESSSVSPVWICSVRQHHAAPSRTPYGQVRWPSRSPRQASPAPVVAGIWIGRKGARQGELAACELTGGARTVDTEAKWSRSSTASAAPSPSRTC